MCLFLGTCFVSKTIFLLFDHVIIWPEYVSIFFILFYFEVFSFYSYVLLTYVTSFPFVNIMYWIFKIYLYYVLHICIIHCLYFCDKQYVCIFFNLKFDACSSLFFCFLSLLILLLINLRI